MTTEVQNIIDTILNAPGVADPQVGTPTGTQDEEKTEKPKLWCIVLHNDNSTNPNFVTKVLVDAIGCNGLVAPNLMMTAHNTGKAVVFSGTKDLAESKLGRADSMIAQAVPRQDYYEFRQGQGCELKLSVEEL